MKPGLLHGVIATGLLSLAAGSWADDGAARWRITCNDGARSDGIIDIEVSPPDDAETLRVSISIGSGTPEDGIARAVATALRRKLDDSLYSVKVAGGEDVLVESNTGQLFGMRVLSNSVRNVTIEIATD